MNHVFEFYLLYIVNRFWKLPGVKTSDKQVENYKLMQKISSTDIDGRLGSSVKKELMRLVKTISSSFQSFLPVFPADQLFNTYISLNDELCCVLKIEASVVIPSDEIY
ncbi:925_t:CDS:2 [Entrophospora sp. SA101]|nr:925_t:CDS:2 [Entrophospora sp. SA101]